MNLVRESIAIWVLSSVLAAAGIGWLWRGGLDRKNGAILRALDGDIDWYRRFAVPGPFMLASAACMAPFVYLVLTIEDQARVVAIACGVQLILFIVIRGTLIYFGRPRWMIPPRYRHLSGWRVRPERAERPR